MSAHLLSVEPGGTPHGSVLHCSGEIDSATVEVFRRALAHSIWSGLPDVAVDLALIVFMDSSAVQALLEAQRELAGRQGRLRVTGGPQAARLFCVLGVAGLLQFTEIVLDRDPSLQNANTTCQLPPRELSSVR